MNEHFRDDARLVLTCIAEDLQEISGRITYLLGHHEFYGSPADEWVGPDDRQRLESISVLSMNLATQTTAALAQIVAAHP